MEKYRAIVTAGGTSEPIDDVRVITNISTGRFGHAIAAELNDQGVSTTFMCPKSTLERLGLPDGVDYQLFTTAESLRQLLLNRVDKPDIIFHATAVADFRPEKVSGKISSDQEEFTISLARNPKIISELRPHFGPELHIVGFKLLSDVPEAELIAAALKLLKNNRLNMVVANDLQWLRNGQHPIDAVTAEGGVWNFNGERNAVARQLVDFVLRRTNVQWYRSTPVEKSLKNEAERDLLSQALLLAHSMNLLTDESGNISASLESGHVTVTPRQVDKSVVTADDAVFAHIDHETRAIEYNGSHKPSIDTGVSSFLYQTFPKVEAMIHFHNGWGRMEASTTFPYPCGVREEAEEIIASLGKVTDCENFAIELTNHGYLIGLQREDLDRLKSEWKAILDEFNSHLKEVDSDNKLSPGLIKPVFEGVHIAGVIYDDPNGAAVYLTQDARGSGLGRQVTNQLKNRQYSVITVDECGVRNFYKRNGFSERFDTCREAYILEPLPKPSRIK